MAKTGESYFAARCHLVEQGAPSTLMSADESGHSDEAVKKGSGKAWKGWFDILDRWGGVDRTHTEIARYLTDEHDVSGWWAQSVTVGYERARGIRAK